MQAGTLPKVPDIGVYLGSNAEVALLPGECSSLMAPWIRRLDQENTYRGDRHLLTIGPNGSGKSRRLLLPNLYRLINWSALVIDLKGELAIWSAKHRKESGSEIITFDPFGVIEKNFPGLVTELPCLASKGLNPIAMLDPKSEDFADDAKAIGEALIKVESKNDAYWSKSAQALVSGLAMSLAANREVDPKVANLGELRKIVGYSLEELGAYINEQVNQYGEAYPGIAAKLNRFKEVSSENREIFSILSSAITHTDWLDSPPIQRNLSDGIFDFSDMKKRPITVYLVLPPRYLESHATWLRLMITAILMPLIRSTGGDVPVLLMLDEFAQLGRLEVIERNIALLRGYGIKLWAVLQDLSQIKDSYEKRWESFIGNAGVIQSFAPQDVTTREYLSKLSGKRLYWVQTTSATIGQQFGVSGYSQSSSQQSGSTPMRDYVYLEDELARMSAGQSVLFEAGNSPRRTWLPDTSEIPYLANILDTADAAAKRHKRK